MEEEAFPFLAFVQRSADQQQTVQKFVFQDGTFARPLQQLSYMRDERLDILETFKEQHEALLEVLRDSIPRYTFNRLLADRKSQVTRMCQGRERGLLETLNLKGKARKAGN